MSTLLVWREKLQKLYAAYSVYILKGIQFVLGLVLFGLINSNIGFMKMASSDLLLCCIHWFNPLVWLAFYLMSQDMEMSCDEITLHHNTTAERKVYSQTLLRLSGKERVVSGCPLSFGENNVKARIRNIMNYKKPGFWILLFSILFVIFIYYCRIFFYS